MNAQRLSRTFAATLVFLAGIPIGLAHAQQGSVRVQGTLGWLQHQSDLHEYYPLRFDNATVFGVAVSASVSPAFSGRFVLETASSHLSGSQVHQSSTENEAHLLTGQVQLLGKVPLSDRITPYAGVGAGLRRSRVKTQILSDDVIYAPWADPQVQPMISILGGIEGEILNNITASAELRYSRVRFRVADDSWGLPEDPVRWQRELQPAIRIGIGL